MKFHLVMKSPDSVNDTIYDLTEAEHSEEDIARAKSMLEAVLQYGEYLTVEFDTDKQSHKVLEIQK